MRLKGPAGGVEHPFIVESQDIQNSGVAPFSCMSTAWRAHEREILAFLSHRLPDRDAAEDVLQDIFVKAIRAGQGFCVLENPRAWLFQVARTTVIDRFRTTHLHEELTPEVINCTAGAADAAPPVATLAGCIARALDALQPTDAAILRACDLNGETQAAYARRHGQSLAAVKSRLLRARQRLRERLVEACEVRFDAQGRVADHADPRPA